MATLYVKVWLEHKLRTHDKSACLPSLSRMHWEERLDRWGLEWAEVIKEDRKHEQSDPLSFITIARAITNEFSKTRLQTYDGHWVWTM